MPSTRPERLVLRAAAARLRERGCYVLRQARATEVGVPDLVACCDGRYVGIEVKRADGGRLSAMQAEHIRLIRAAGGLALVISHEDDLDALFEASGDARAELARVD